MKELEKIFKAFANKRRLAILAYLKRSGEATVGDIAAEIKLSFKSTSKHLYVLAAADIIEKDQRGPQVFYQLTPNPRSSVRQLIDLI
ncbi:MAG: Transcriptional regulator, ArsR family [Parcubacteria group bacterium GW2011_GWB1_40_14]|nr:MAG: Transcriptional regulator, ArsR family [Parcubacteria group bacterium GW2011_GWB1_40_14]